MQPPAELQVFLLGSPQIQQGEHALAIPRLQTRALFYRLAVHLQPVAREHLCFLFWPDTSDQVAHRNLTLLLSRLRHALPAPAILVTSTDHVRLAADQVWCDSILFEHFCAGQKTSSRFDDFQTAVQLYGGPLLSGFVAPPDCPEYDLWLANERRTFERMYLDALTALIEACTARGKVEDAIPYAQCYLEIDELAEEMHRQLMRLYDLTGERSAARRQFEICAAVLERELGVSPLPETYALYQAILEGQIVARPQAAQEPIWATLAGPNVPMVGREPILQSIQQFYEQATDGRGSVVLLTGEAGIGKSRLMQEFATHLPGQVPVLTAASHPGVQSIPYQLVVEALRPAMQKPTNLSAVTSTWLSVASLLFPEIRTLYPQLPAPTLQDPEQARGQIFEALCQLLRAWSNQTVVVLCLDDLHWSDSTTLDWLSYLVRSLRHSRLLILGAYRSEEAGSLSVLRDHLSRYRVLSEFQLAPLGVAEANQLLAHVYPERAGIGALAARLQKITGGNPFFLLESVQALLETHTLPVTLPEDAELPISSNVRATIERRMERLRPMARQVLEAGAILGPAFEFDVVRQTAGRSEMESVEGLDELVARRFFEEQGTRYGFRHELIQAVVYRTLSYWRRQLLHRRVAEILEQRHPDPHDPASGQIAVHYERGGLTPQAIPFYQRAAAVAERVFATQEAVQYLTKALNLLKSLPDSAEERQRELDIQIALGLALTTLKGWSARELKEIYTRALELCDEVGDVAQRFQAVWGLHSYYQVQAEFTQARVLADELVRLVQDGQHPALAPFAYFHLGSVLLQQGNFVEARSYFEQTITLHDPRQSHPAAVHFRPDYGVFARCFVAHTLWHLGLPDQALVHSNQALALATEFARPYDLVVALTYAATLHLFCRQIEPVQELAQAAVTRCVEHGFAYFLAWATILLGWAQVEIGEVEKGIAQMRHGLADFDKTGAGVRRPYYLGLLAEALGRAGQVEEGLALLAEALALTSARGEGWSEAELYRLQGELLLAHGAAEEEAERQYERAMAVARRQQAKSFELRAAMSLAHLWRRQGKREAAHTMLAALYQKLTEGFDTPDLKQAQTLLCKEAM